jgi:RNA polymerase sigma-70 factor, ECF subfamily
VGRWNPEVSRRLCDLPFVDWVVEAGRALSDQVVMSQEEFRAFYRVHVSEVYGYLLRLCAGNRAQAEDLTQDVWFALVDEMGRGHAERADVRWLISVARSRFLDHARRERLGRSKLVLLRRSEQADVDPTSGAVLDRLADLQPLHRAVLVLRYVDDLPVPQVAAVIGREVAATNSLLARARAELRRVGRGDPDD